MASLKNLASRRNDAAARAPKLTRAERSELTRKALFDAAVAVVGEVGYEAAMVSEITGRAGIAQGTFYNYFESRQDLFDTLLPELGGEMLKFIGEETIESRDEIEREERAFRAFFTFLKTRPEFYRILYEAEVFAPKAFKRHLDTVAKGYVRTLQRAIDRGQLKSRIENELEAIAFMLMGVRHYLCIRYARRDSETVSLPEWVVHSYMTIVTSNLFVRSSRSRRPSASLLA